MFFFAHKIFAPIFFSNFLPRFKSKNSCVKIGISSGPCVKFAELEVAMASPYKAKKNANHQISEKFCEIFSYKIKFFSFRNFFYFGRNFFFFFFGFFCRLHGFISIRSLVLRHYDPVFFHFFIETIVKSFSFSVCQFFPPPAAQNRRNFVRRFAGILRNRARSIFCVKFRISACRSPRHVRIKRGGFVAPVSLRRPRRCAAVIILEWNGAFNNSKRKF